MTDRPDQDAERGRRRFLSRLSLGVGGLVTVAVAIPFIGFLIAPARRRPRPAAWRDIGALTDFEMGSTTRVVYPDPEPDPWSGLAVRNAAWLRRDGPAEFTAFSIYCTHTGCPVRWIEDAGLFLCPCHGGVFDRNGSVSAGPPPRPLDRAPVRIRNGRVEIQPLEMASPT